MPTSALRRLIVSPEVTWGTAVSPATKVMGATAITPRLQQDVFQSSELGTLSPSGLVALVRESGGFATGMDLSYEDINFPLSAIDAPAMSGTGPYNYLYTLPSASATVSTAYTMLMEWGDASAEYQAEGCIAQDLTISGDVNGAGVWQASQDWIAQKLYPTTATATPADRSVELIRMADTTLYFDLVGGTVGTTAKAAVLISFTWTVTSGRHLKHFAGDIFPLNYGIGLWSGQLSLVCEMDAGIIATLATMFGTLQQRQVRLHAVSGVKVAWLDFAGYLVAAPLVLDQDRDGNSTVELVLQGTYNTAMSSWAGMRVVNNLATWPPP